MKTIRFYKNFSFLLLLAVLVLLYLFFSNYQEIDELEEQNFFLKKSLLAEQLNKKLTEQNYSSLLKSLKDKGFSISKFQSFDVFIANVIGRSALNWEEEFVIDLGERDGIYVNAPVIYGDYLVGLVREISDSKAVVKTIFSKQLNIGCDLKGFNAVGVLQGKFEDEEKICLLNYMPKSYDYALGSLVYSSRKSFMIPQGLLIGKIRDLKENKLYKQALIRYPLNLRSLENVVVLVKKKKL